MAAIYDLKPYGICLQRGVHLHHLYLYRVDDLIVSDRIHPTIHTLQQLHYAGYPSGLRDLIHEAEGPEVQRCA